MSSPEESKSYLSSISSFSPWGSRSTTSKPQQPRELDGQGLGPPSATIQQHSVDHTVSRMHRLSWRNYPRDCPPLTVQWFHAVDVPKRKPNPVRSNERPSTPSTLASERPLHPKKYVPFSPGDSRAIEAAFQKLAEEEDATGREKLLRRSERDQRSNEGHSPAAKNRASQDEAERGRIKVPVNEDYLFDVDVERRELMPAYWLGPVYDVRRGTWFYSDGKPCEENLATQLEEGYLKVKPWKFFTAQHHRSSSQPRSRPTSMRLDDRHDFTQKPASTPLTPKSSTEDLKAGKRRPAERRDAGDDFDPNPNRAFRLFGNYMNSVVTYQNANLAWIVNDDFLSKMSSTLYERFAGGGYYAGTKVTRGHSGFDKRPDSKDEKTSATSVESSPRQGPLQDRDETSSEPDQRARADSDQSSDGLAYPAAASETRRRTLERHMSSLVESGKLENPEEQEEEVRRRDEKEIQDDYKDREGDEQGREIEHLLLVTHGIGQRLGLRLESVNFVHDVNTMRTTLKEVYHESADLQTLNGDIDKEIKNCRVQVLPICWRHLLDFPRQSLKHNRKEHDLGDLDFADEEYPNLDDITVEGVPAVRNLITDLALDILLYQSPAYKGHITRIVLEECNRIFKLFKQRNPNFKGKISLVGHSLGSAIMFDILCNQRVERARANSRHHQHRDHQRLQLEFEVDDFFALGSPIGLFQMLKGRTIAARQTLNLKPAQTPFSPIDDPFLGPAPISSTTASDPSYVEITTSSPKCQQIFNIFHPTDPIAYRLEPLISPAMGSLKPQPLPYTKKGIFTATVGQGLTGIGARVGQSVSGLWSNFSSSIASSLLNRSLGISSDEASRLSNPLPQQQQRAPASAGAGTNVSAGVVPSEPLQASEAAATLQQQQQQATAATQRQRPQLQTRLTNQADIEAGDEGEHPPTLIDGELETLFSGFQKRRLSHKSDADVRDLGENAEWRELEEQGRRLKREEGKVRALNANGRVDYSIQEGAFDISLLASIASHLSYWGDEDVNHFIISQLLARHRVFKGSRPGTSQGRGGLSVQEQNRPGVWKPE